MSAQPMFFGVGRQLASCTSLYDVMVRLPVRRVVSAAGFFSCRRGRHSYQSGGGGGGGGRSAVDSCSAAEQLSLRYRVTWLLVVRELLPMLAISIINWWLGRSHCGFKSSIPDCWLARIAWGEWSEEWFHGSEPPDEPSSVFSRFYNLDRLNVPATANRTLAFEVEERGAKNSSPFLAIWKCSIDMIPIYCKCVVVGDGCVKSFLASFFLFYIRWAAFVRFCFVFRSLSLSRGVGKTCLIATFKLKFFRRISSHGQECKYYANKF